MKTSWIATITFFSTRGRCFTKAIAHSKAIERDIILLIVEIKKNTFISFEKRSLIKQWVILTVPDSSSNSWKVGNINCTRQQFKYVERFREMMIKKTIGMYQNQRPLFTSQTLQYLSSVSSMIKCLVTTFWLMKVA